MSKNPVPLKALPSERSVFRRESARPFAFGSRGPGQTGVHSVSVVVHRDAGVVLHDISLPVTDVEGIDGGYGRGEGEEVGRRVSLPVRAQRIVGEVGVTGVGTDLQPFLAW